MVVVAEDDCDPTVSCPCTQQKCMADAASVCVHVRHKSSLCFVLSHIPRLLAMDQPSRYRGTRPAQSQEVVVSKVASLAVCMVIITVKPHTPIHSLPRSVQAGPVAMDIHILCIHHRLTIEFKCTCRCIWQQLPLTPSDVTAAPR